MTNKTHIAEEALSLIATANNTALPQSVRDAAIKELNILKAKFKEAPTKIRISGNFEHLSAEDEDTLRKVKALLATVTALNITVEITR